MGKEIRVKRGAVPLTDDVPDPGPQPGDWYAFPLSRVFESYGTPWRTLVWGYSHLLGFSAREVMDDLTPSMLGHLATDLERRYRGAKTRMSETGIREAFAPLHARLKKSVRENLHKQDYEADYTEELIESLAERTRLRDYLTSCESACNNDPSEGMIGVEN